MTRDIPPIHLDDEPMEPTPQPTLRAKGELSESDRLERCERALGSLLKSRRTTTLILGIVVPALLTGMGTVLVWAVREIAAYAERVGETAAKLESLKEWRATQQDDIREVRACCQRRSSVDPHPIIPDPTRPTSGDDALPPGPDRLSLLDHGASMPASTIGDSGLTLRHVPKLQYGQVRIEPVLHSMLLLHVAPQVDGGGGGTRSCGADGGDELQATRTTNTNLSIPSM